jgi:hypothetical protein
MTSRLEVDRTREVTRQDLGIVSLFSEREPERYVLHSRHMNEMMVRVLNTIGQRIRPVSIRPRRSSLPRSAQRLGRIWRRPESSKAS